MATCWLERAEDLARSASDRFGEIVGGKEGHAATPSADAMQPVGRTIGLVEQIHGWTARSSADYQELMRGLSQPPQVNPVADAAAKVAARGAQQGPSGEQKPETLPFIEAIIGWAHRAALHYQTVVRGLLSEPGQTVVAAKGPETEAKAKQAEDARRLAEVLKAAEAKKVDEVRTAAARQAEEARRVAEAEKAAEAKKADEVRMAAAKQAEDARQAEEARRAAETRKAAEEARVAAERAEDARKAEEARRVAEAQKAAEAKKAEEARVAAAKQAEEARRVAEAQKAAEAKRAEEARVAAAAKQAEEARRVAEAQKAVEAKKAEEARVAAAKQAEEARRVADAQKSADGKTTEVQRRAAAVQNKRTETKEPERTTPVPSRKRTAVRQPREKERSARKGAGGSRVAGTRKRVRQAASAVAGKSRRKKPAHDTCRAAGIRAKTPGWYIVRRGDTLWKIAARHYGDGRRYPVISKANARRIGDPNLIVRCQRIYLPKFRRRG
jgi:nucleoid-associated protein YgaU